MSLIALLDDTPVYYDRAFDTHIKAKQINSTLAGTGLNSKIRPVRLKSTISQQSVKGKIIVKKLL